MTVWILWWKDLDGSKSGIARVYDNEVLAADAYSLVKDASDSKVWMLAEKNITAPQCSA